MRKRFSITLILAFLTLNVQAAREYPTRPITNTVVWSAGGGTDAVNRMVMAEMSKALGKRINVSNKVGGVAGSIGMNFVIKKRADGYNLVGISSSNVVAAVNGGWDKRFDVWSPFIVGSSPDVISVHVDSPYKTLEELIAAAKKAPNTLKAGAGGAGGIHHLYLLELSKATDAEFKFIPYPGSAPSQSAVITKEVDFVITSMAEQAPLLRGKKLRPLAMLHPKAFNLASVANIPSAFTRYPSLSKRLPLNQAIGFAVNVKTPQAVRDTLARAFEKAMKSKAVTEWADKNYYELSGLYGEAARKEFSRLESIFTWALNDLGSNKLSPEKFGIPKPE